MPAIGIPEGVPYVRQVEFSRALRAARDRMSGAKPWSVYWQSSLGGGEADGCGSIGFAERHTVPRGVQARGIVEPVNPQFPSA